MIDHVKTEINHLTLNNLGEIAGPLLFFGGPYSNLQATKALIEQIERLDIPSSNVFCTGDIVAYCGNPKETVELMQESGFHFIQGNCEENLSNAANDCGCGFDEGSTCAVLSEKWYNLAQIETTLSQKKWMGTLPHRIEFTFEGRYFHILHGSNKNISEFIFPSTCVDKKAEIIGEIGCDVVIAGHCGLPFTQKIDDKLWHNPGVIGLPPNDGTTRVWYSLLQAEKGELVFSHHSIDYDYMNAAKAMRVHGLDEYANALETGLYPSLSILPGKEKEETGVPLKFL